MIEVEDYIWQEWREMVGRATSNLSSTCPLLEDEVLVEIDKLLLKLYAKTTQFVGESYG